MYYDGLSADLATVRVLLGDPQGALAPAREAIQVIQARSSTTRARPWLHLAAALAQAQLGASSDAADNLETAIRLAESAGVFLEANECLLYAGAIAYQTGEVATASRLLAAAVAVGDARQTPAPFRRPSSDALYRHYLPRIREALGAQQARRCRDQGQAMTIEQALATARDLTETLRAQTVEDEP